MSIAAACIGACVIVQLFGGALIDRFGAPWSGRAKFGGSFFLALAAPGLALLVLGWRRIKDPAPCSDVTEEGVVDFIGSIARGIFKVAIVPHVWIASLQGAALVGILLWFGLGSLPWPGLLGVLLSVSTAMCVLSFNAVNDVVPADHMGTSAAIVTSVMFLATCWRW